MDPVVARKMWRTLEPYHGLIYFAHEATIAYEALGLTASSRSGYFVSRSAPMGAVSPEVTIATFYNFEPTLVRRAMNGAWDAARPELVIAARARAASAALVRIIGDASAGSAEMREAVDLARRATDGCRPEGRPLYAGHAQWAWPGDDQPHLQLWHAITLLREFRGDGHVAALTSSGVDGCEALVCHGASGDIAPALLQSSRGWSDDAWTAANDRLRARGWLDEAGAFTEAGRARRQAVEDATDELALSPWQLLGEDGCDRLRQLVRPWSRAVVDSGELFGGGARQPG
ncbi:MAG: SCO6745 family protein [Actinomycetota bacterium]